MANADDSKGRPTELEVKEISLSFGGLAVLQNVNVSADKGTIVGVVGPNGAGKTCLLNCLTGAYRPDRGEMAYRGRRLNGMRPSEIAQIGIARTFQGVQMVPGLSVLENVLLGRHVRYSHNLFEALLYVGWGRRAEMRQRAFAAQVLHRLGMTQLATRDALSLPYGQQRLVEIARVLASEPSLILFDEPTSGMNRRERSAIARVIEQLRGEGLTQIIVEHDVAFITELCDLVIVLNFGEVIAMGSPEAVLADERVIEAYVGGDN